mgnify:CR=1 FL=1
MRYDQDSLDNVGREEREAQNAGKLGGGDPPVSPAIFSFLDRDVGEGYLKRIGHPLRRPVR